MRRQSFTLVELLVVIVIIAIVLALVLIPGRALWRQRHEAASITLVENMLRTARQTAAANLRAAGLLAYLDGAEQRLALIESRAIPDLAAGEHWVGTVDRFAVIEHADSVRTLMGSLRLASPKALEGEFEDLNTFAIVFLPAGVQDSTTDHVFLECRDDDQDDRGDWTNLPLADFDYPIPNYGGLWGKLKNIVVDEKGQPREIPLRWGAIVYDQADLEDLPAGAWQAYLARDGYNISLSPQGESTRKSAGPR